MLRFETAGESHGECLVATLTGLPAGIPISVAALDRELWRRQQGFGRGGRMKIETDRAHIVSGVRHSQTIGSPIAILIENKDWKNWTEALPVEDMEGSEAHKKPVTRPRPGHADLGGRDQVQFPRRAVYSGARQCARDGRPRRRGRAGESVSRGIRHRRAEPRDRGGRGQVGAACGLGGTGRAEPARRSSAGLRGCGSRAAHEGGGGSGLSDRRHRRRRLRSGRARRASRPRFAHRLGYAPGRETGAGHRFDAGGEGRGGRFRGGRRGGVRVQGAGYDRLRSRAARTSRAAPIAPAGWKAA